MGVIATREALDMARAKKVDLVEVAPQAIPPVCRLLDFGKFMYEKTKREREARKSHKMQIIKELRIMPTTDEYHVGFKVRQVRRYLAEGAKVKISVLFRGRSITHPEVGRKQLMKIMEDLGADAVVEQSPKMEGRSLQMLLAPAGHAPAKPKAAKPAASSPPKPKAEPEAPTKASPQPALSPPATTEPAK